MDVQHASGLGAARKEEKAAPKGWGSVPVTIVELTEEEKAARKAESIKRSTFVVRLVTVGEFEEARRRSLGQE